MDDISKSGITKKVIEMSNTWRGVSDIHKQTLTALIGVFNKLSYIDEENKIVDVRCIYGGPERAIARINAENNIILPVISVVPKARENSEDRRKFSPVLQNNTYWSHTKQRAVRLVNLAPKAMNLNYEVNVWGKYLSNVNQLTEQCRRIFNPAMTLETPLHDQTQAFLTKEENGYQVKLGDSDDRVIVKKFLVKVETYIPTPMFMITSTGEIEEFHGEIKIDTEL